MNNAPRINIYLTKQAKLYDIDQVIVSALEDFIVNPLESFERSAAGSTKTLHQFHTKRKEFERFSAKTFFNVQNPSLKNKIAAVEKKYIFCKDQLEASLKRTVQQKDNFLQIYLPKYVSAITSAIQRGRDLGGLELKRAAEIVSEASVIAEKALAEKERRKVLENKAQEAKVVRS